MRVAQGGIAFEFSKRKPDGGSFDWDNRAVFVLDLPEIGEFAVDQADPVSPLVCFTCACDDHAVCS